MRSQIISLGDRDCMKMFRQDTIIALDIFYPLAKHDKECLIWLDIKPIGLEQTEQNCREAGTLSFGPADFIEQLPFENGQEDVL